MTRYLAILCLASAALAQPRVDQHGDALPEGAISRFGTVRYRIGDTPVEACAISPDGKKIVIETRDEIRLWDLDTGRPVIKFTGIEDLEAVTNQFHFSSDGKTLISVGSQ